VTPSSDLGFVGMPHAGSATVPINATRTTATSSTLPNPLRDITSGINKVAES
jgi:hypothetical protein